MNSVLVIVTDGVKARFFSVESEETPTGDSRPCLREKETLVNPEGKLPGQELWSGAASQAGHYQTGKGRAHSYDDRRQDHEVEFERRFAREIADQAIELIESQSIRSLLLVAAPQILGILREFLIPALPDNLQLTELDKNLSHLKPLALQAYLTEKALLAPI